MNKQLFDQDGNFIGELPEQAIKECSQSGQVFESVKYWQQKLHFECNQDQARKWLQEFGAWEDLKTIDDITINQRVLWIACCDINEFGEWLGTI